MTRLTRRIRLSAALETGYAGSPGTYFPILLSEDPKFTITHDMVDRDIVRDFLGGSEQIPANAEAEISFTTELWASGTAGTAAAWGPLLRACGYAETITAAQRVEYTPISDSFESLRFKINNDGVEYIVKGCYGTAVLDMTPGALPKINWTFKGVQIGHSAVAFGSPVSLSAWKKPQVIRDENAGALLLGSTYSAGAFTGGTPAPLRQLKIDLGTKVEYSEELTQSATNGQRMLITDRNVTGDITVRLSAADEVSWRTDIVNGVETGMGFVLGSTAGSILKMFSANTQRVTPQRANYNGMAYMQSGLRMIPGSGNDEFRLVVM